MHIKSQHYKLKMYSNLRSHIPNAFLVEFGLKLTNSKKELQSSSSYHQTNSFIWFLNSKTTVLTLQSSLPCCLPLLRTFYKSCRVFVEENGIYVACFAEWSFLIILGEYHNMHFCFVALALLLYYKHYNYYN